MNRRRSGGGGGGGEAAFVPKAPEANLKKVWDLYRSGRRPGLKVVQPAGGASGASLDSAGYKSLTLEQQLAFVTEWHYYPHQALVGSTQTEVRIDLSEVIESLEKAIEAAKDKAAKEARRRTKAEQVSSQAAEK